MLYDILCYFIPIFFAVINVYMALSNQSIVHAILALIFTIMVMTYEICRAISGAKK